MLISNIICRLEVLDEAEEENVGENEDQQTVKAHCMSFSEFWVPPFIQLIKPKGPTRKTLNLPKFFAFSKC